MKPFNLEEYCKNSSSKLVTRGGKKVTRLSYTDIENIFPITAIIEDNNNRKFMRTYTKEGTYYEDKSEHSDDLFFTSTKHEGWINLYHDGFNEPYWMNKVYNSEEDAKNNAHGNIATIKIEWEE